MFRPASCLLLLLTLVLAAVPAQAGEYLGEHFALTIPEGWVKSDEAPDDGVFVVVMQEQATDCMVSVTLRPTALSARELCDDTVSHMKGKGFKLTGPVQDGAAWRLAFTQRRTGLCGEQIFSANGGMGAILSVFAMKAEHLDHAKDALRKHFRAVNTALFPTAF